MSAWVGTFPIDSGRAKHFVEFEAADEASAREVMFDWYGERWAFVYPSREEAGVERFGLHLTELGLLNPRVPGPYGTGPVVDLMAALEDSIAKAKAARGGVAS